MTLITTKILFQFSSIPYKWEIVGKFLELLLDYGKGSLDITRLKMVYVVYIKVNENLWWFGI
jgi:hypothetical protein